MISKNIVTIKDLAQVKRFSALGGPPSLRRSCRWQDWRSLWSIIARPNSSWPDHYAAPQALSLAVPDAEKVLQFLFNENERTLFFWIIFCNTFWAQWLGQSWSQFLRKCTCFLKKNFFLQQLTRAARILMTSRGLVDLEEIVLFPCLVQSWLCWQDGRGSSTKSQRPKSSQRRATLPTTCSHIWHRTRRNSSSYWVCLVKTWKSEEKKPKLLLYQHRCRLPIIASISSKQTWSGLPAN